MVSARSDGNELTDPNTAGVWAENSVWPQDPGFDRARAGGVTGFLILPGSGNLFGGRAARVVMNGHAAAKPRKRAGGRGADAGRCAGDENCLALELRSHWLLRGVDNADRHAATASRMAAIAAGRGKLFR